MAAFEKLFLENTSLTFDGMRMFGRRIITDNFEPNELTVVEFQQILKDSLEIHAKNVKEIQYLYDYVKGNQPILYRTNKEVRPEINNKSVENWAKVVLKFKLGFLYGEPIQLIKNSNKGVNLLKKAKSLDETTIDEQVMLLNDYYQEVDKHQADKECGFWTITCGVGYECILPTKEKDAITPFEVFSLDPRYTYIIYSNSIRKQPLMAITYSINNADDPNKTTIDFVAYTENRIYTATVNREIEILKFDVLPNILGVIPIIEFNYDDLRQGGFEPALSLLDNINLICSDRMNDVQQAVQWFIKFINVDIDEEMYEKFKAKGAIVVKGEPGNPPQVEVVSSALNQTQIQTFKDDMIKCLCVITNIPERGANPSGNTGQALIIGKGWADAEADAQDVEVGLRKGQKKLLKIAIAISKLNSNVPNSIKDTLIETIDIKFTRNRSDNLLIKTQALRTMLDAGVAPILAFKICGLFDDPQKAYELSKETLDMFYLNNKNKNNTDQIPNQGKGEIDPEDSEHNQLMESISNKK